MKTRYTIIPKPLPPPEAFQRTVHEAEIISEYFTDGTWFPTSGNEPIIRELARHGVHSFADKPKKMDDNRLLSMEYFGEGVWLVRIEEAYLD